MTLADRERERVGASAPRYSAVSLFCGAGGLDFGLSLAGIKTVWATDADPDSCKTFKAWSDAEVVCGDINRLDLSRIPTSEIIVGGFPCQGFSLAGPRRVDDSRNKLYQSFVRVVQGKQPLAFVAENVKGILTMAEGRVFEAITSDFANAGYTVRAYPCNAADYEVPQDRQRVIIVGFRNDLDFLFAFPETRRCRLTIREALEGLPSPGKGDVCTDPFSPRYMSRNRKRRWSQQSYTIPAMAKQVPLHPSSPDMIKVGTDEWEFGPGTTRRFSWQEAAAIQTFPRDFPFSGNLASVYRQIGNAVPVMLAYHIGTSLVAGLEEACGRGKSDD